MAMKREMKARLRSDPNQFEQTIFEFELLNDKPVAASFEWEEEDEFRYNGSIYDVIEKEITGNILKLRCIDDKDEARIIKKMEELQKNGQGNNKSESIPLQQLLSLLLFNQHNGCERVNLFSPLNHIAHYCGTLTPVILDIVGPPPRKVNLFAC